MSEPEALTLTEAELKKLAKLLSKFGKFVRQYQPRAAEIISTVYRWVDSEIE